MNLGDVLADPGRFDEDLWLCLPERSWPWSLDTPCAVLAPEMDDDDEEPPAAAELGMVSVLGMDTVSHIAEVFAGRSPRQVFRAFRYYADNDAWLDAGHLPPPPSGLPAQLAHWAEEWGYTDRAARLNAVQRAADEELAGLAHCLDEAGHANVPPGLAATVELAREAEVIVVNTCGFIGEAKKESIDAIFEMARLKEEGRCQRLVVAGCLSQRHPDELAREIPEVDHFLGSSDMLKLERVLEGKAERMLVGNPADWVVGAADPRTVSTPGGSAYVKIAEGCSRTCSFCVIPDLRGKQRSRRVEDIVAEVERLASLGTREINLVSQDTIAYGRDLDASDRGTLASLVERVADVPGVRWVRLFYLYPEAMKDDLIELLAQHPRVVPYVDMPLQHAADGMLRRMRRGHGGARLRKLVSELKSRVPDLTFRTAFIVGHPGETDEEFKELCDFVTWAEFDRVGVFRYSDEETSRSFSIEGKVPARVAASRHRKLMALQRRISHAKNAALVGRELDVLVEGQSDEHEYVMMGRHAGQAPDIDGQVYLSGGEARAGEMRRVRIEQASDYDLVGELIDEGDQVFAESEARASSKPSAPKSPSRAPKRVSLRVLQTDGRDYQRS